MSNLIHKKPRRIQFSTLRADPTRTTTLRRLFTQNLMGRLNLLIQRIMKVIGEENALGLDLSTGFEMNSWDEILDAEPVQSTLSLKQRIQNVFCPTGKGGGVDPHCSPLGKTSLENLIKEAKESSQCSVSGSGFCRPTAIALWHKLGNPTDLTPHTVTVPDNPKTGDWGAPDHVVLYSKSRNLVIDPTSEQWNLGHSGAKEDYPYFRYKEISHAEIQSIREDWTKRLGRPLINTRWAFRTPAEQVQAFSAWFMQEAQDLLYPSEENSWWKEYIEQAYYQSLNSTTKRYSKPYQAALSLNASSAEKVKALQSRTLVDLKGVVHDMNTRMVRTILDGMAQGKTSKQLARELIGTVNGIGKVRAAMVGSGSPARASNEAALDSLEALGLDQVGVMVEWTTSGLGKTKVRGRGKNRKGGNQSPCHLCAPLAGVVMTIQQARGMFPRHPNCLCSPVPVLKGDKKPGQLTTKREVSTAMKNSIRAEMPKTIKRTLAEQRQRTSWPGAKEIK